MSATSNRVEADAGASVTVTVTPTGTSCTAWTATVASTARWITITSGERGTGIGTVTYSYRANMSAAERRGTLTIAGQTYTVTQAGRPLAADSYEGGAARNNTPATAHLFAADFSPRLQPNAVASIDISSASCDIASDVDIYKIILPTDYTYTLTATLFDSYNQINNSNYTLDAKISCSTDGFNWNSSRDVTLTTAVPGGTLYLKIEPYSSGRVGTYAAKIELKAGCRGVLSESKKLVTREVGVVELTVTTGPSCIWTAASNVEWITVTSEASAIGSGNVSYSYTENTSLASRTGTITIAGETYTVTQAPAPDRHEENNTAAQAFSLASKALQNDSVIHISSVNCHTADDVDIYKIALGAGYTYTLSGALYDLLNQNEGNRYTLDAKISYSTNGNGTAWSEPVDRQLLPATVPGGTLYLKIEPFSRGVGTYAAKIEIKRAGTTGCTYTLSPANKQAAKAEGADRVAVNSASTCFWATTSDVKWITVESGSGTGEGHAAYSYLANMSPNPRTGHLTIADQTYTVTQAGRQLEPDAYEGSEGNNTQAKAHPFPAPTFNEHNVGTVNILQASCHLANDLDFYKIELETGYTYRLSGALHDEDNQVNHSNYTLDAKISYSINNANWSETTDSQLSIETVQGGSLYLKIEPYYNGDTGTYAAKIEIKRVVATGCTYRLSSDRKAATAPAGSDQVTVTATGSSCVWTATSNDDWITITSGASAIGSGNVAYSYTENTSLYSRTGTISIADKTYTVTQARRPVPPDTYEPNNSKEEARLLPANFSPSLQENATASIDISPASCHLTSGDVDYYKIELGTGYTYTFSGALYDLRNQNEGGNYTLDAKISYSTDNGSTWSATADFWLSPRTVPGGTLYLKIDSYGGNVGTYAAKIDIRAGCRAFLPVLRKTAPSTAGSDQITVISGSSCTSSWTAASDADWLTFTGGARTATSTGNITYSYAANPIADLRTGAIIVAGQVYTVTQAPSPDSYEPNNTPAAVQQPNSPSSLTPEFNNQNAGVIRISPANCHTVDDVDIYKINLEAGYAYDIRGTLYDLYNPQGNSHYTLDAQIYYSTDEGENWSYSYGSEFSVSRTLGGNPLYLKIVSVSSSDEEKMGTYAAEINISRTVACTYTLSERRKQVTSAAGSGVSVTVTASSSCTAPWEARSNASWITLTPASRGSRTGSGSITYSYLENTEWVSRTGTITIAGKTYTVTQMHPSIDPDRYEGDEGNNTAERAALLTATFANNASVINISQANCHLASDVDYYKIELEAGYTYTLSGTLYDSYSSTDGVNYTLDAKISYSANNGANWSNSSDTGLPPAAVPGGTLHLKIEPYYSGRVGTYAAKIEITRSACAYAFSPARGAAPATGGPGEVTVTTACFWEAVSNADWITLSQTSGTGTTTLTYSVATNTGEEREGTITIARQTYTVRQEAAPCAYSFRESSVAIPAEASTDRRAEIITTRESCQWTSSSHADWITLSQTSGTGTTTLTYSVATNTGEEREGTITIAGQTYTVRQEAAPCAYSFRESSVAIPAEASTDRRAEITATRESCQWTASSNADWITLSQTSGTGTTTLTYSVATNTGEEREGTITIAGQTYTVRQEAAPCAYSFRESSVAIPAEASTDRRAEITATRESCQWTASSEADWITLSQTSGTGTTTLTYSVTTNTGEEREGTITIAGQTYTVRQEAAPCAYSFRESSVAIPAEASTDRRAEITATRESCQWTASSNADWITLSRTSGTGTTTLTYSVTANTGILRTGTITIAGQTYTVRQEAAPCAYSFRESSVTIPAEASTDRRAEITATRESCQWTASSEADWITLSRTSGTGTTTLTYSVATNTGEEREGTITIAGQTYTVRQEAAPCAYSFRESSVTIPAEASTDRRAEITATRESCQWTASSNADWITLSRTSGTGTTTVTYSVTANTGILRTGTITIAGQTHTVTQAGTVTGFQTVSPVKIYPNPAKDFVTIDWTGKGAQCASVKIANQFGQILYEIKNPGRAVQIPLKGLAAGLYFILLQEEEKTAAQKLLVE